MKVSRKIAEEKFPWILLTITTVVFTFDKFLISRFIL